MMSVICNINDDMRGLDETYIQLKIFLKNNTEFTLNLIGKPP